MNILEVEKLVKNYGRFKAVDGISFNIPKGKVVGFLGPNGAGKTTTIQILLGITSANSGKITYFGRDFFKNRQHCLQKINFASSFNTLQGRISVIENLLVFASLYKVKNSKQKIQNLINTFEIEDLINQKYWDLSAGQKTRVNLIKSLINDPELILMDEPTASLDPDIADKTLSLIEKLRKERELSILFTSHNMDEVARICDQVIFLDRGNIVAQDTPLGLTKRITKANLEITFVAKQSVVEEKIKPNTRSFKFIRKNTVSIETEEKLIPKIIYDVSQGKTQITDIEIKKPTLEDVFLQIARNSKNVT